MKRKDFNKLNRNDKIAFLRSTNLPKNLGAFEDFPSRKMVQMPELEDITWNDVGDITIPELLDNRKQGKSKEIRRL